MAVDCYSEAPEDVIGALARLEHLETLSGCSTVRVRPGANTQTYMTPPTATTMERLSRLPRLRAVEISSAPAALLAAFDDHPHLEQLVVFVLVEADRWNPQLPYLRSLFFSECKNTHGEWALPALEGCPRLERVETEWQGPVDRELAYLGALKAVRHIVLGRFGGGIVTVDGIESLAAFARLRSLELGNNGYLEVPAGRLRRLETLQAVERLQCRLSGATDADIAWLSNRLPNLTGWSAHSRPRTA